MVIKTSDKKRDDIFFKAISSVLDRDGLLIDFRGGWFKWYGGYIESQHFWGDTKEKIGSSRLIEISDWHNYREFDDLFLSVNLKDKNAELILSEELYSKNGWYFPIISMREFLDSLPENFKIKFYVKKGNRSFIFRKKVFEIDLDYMNENFNKLLREYLEKKIPEILMEQTYSIKPQIIEYYPNKDVIFSEEFCDLIFKESPDLITDNLLNSDFISGYDDLEKVFSLVMKYTKPSQISLVIGNISNAQSVIERAVLKDISSKDENVRRTNFLKKFNSFLEDSISDYLINNFASSYRRLLGNIRNLRAFSSIEFKNLFSSEFVIEKDFLEALFKNSVELGDLSYFIETFKDSYVTEDNKLDYIKNIKVEVFNNRLLSELSSALDEIKSSQRFKDIVAKNIKLKFVESINVIGFDGEIDDDKFAIPPISQELIDILEQYKELGIESNLPEEVVNLYYKYEE
jgi:hypothetical protein